MSFILMILQVVFCLGTDSALINYNIGVQVMRNHNVMPERVKPQGG